jgi:hypothetical protein
MKNVVIVILLALLVTGCAEGERAVRKKAVAEVENHPELPEGATIDRSEVTIHLGQSAAYADVPYEYTDESGRTVDESYTVWMKRIAVRWEIDTIRKTEKYPVEPTTSWMLPR